MSSASKPHSVPPVAPEEIAKAVEKVRAIVQGEMDELMAENKRLEEQLEAAQDRIRILERLRIEESNAVGLTRISNPASSPGEKTDGYKHARGVIKPASNQESRDA